MTRWAMASPSSSTPPPNVSRPRILVISADAVGKEMAGTGIRAYEVARALQPHGEVTLAAVESTSEPVDDVHQVSFHVRDSRALRPYIETADVIFAQPQWPTIHGWLRESDARLIFDLYNVESFEALEFLRERKPWLRRAMSTMGVDRMTAALRDGNHFVCASDDQRDFWLGVILAERLIGPESYDRDPTFLSVIDKLPFGLPSAPPSSGGRGPRSRFSQIGESDEIVLWNGGIWSWLDAPTAVGAVAELASRRPTVKLVFMGAASQGPALRATEEARELARRLGVLDTTVLFNDGWVPYTERGDWLLDADAAISTHVEHLETRFAFRTRLLDCFWAGLPVVCTRGDELARIVEAEDLGEAVPQSDPTAVAAALERVLDRDRAEYTPQLAAAAERFAWANVVAPVPRWLQSPPPPPLGNGVARHPSAAARDIGYRAVRALLNRAGLRDWPRL